MRKPKTSPPGIDQQKDEQIDLDPITNDQLVKDVRRQLLDRLKKTTRSQVFANSKATPAQDFSGESSISRLNLSDELDELDGLPNGSQDRRAFGRNIRRLVKLVHKAILNPIYIELDVEDYYLNSVKKKKKISKKSQPDKDGSELSKLKAGKKRRKSLKKLTDESKEESAYPDISLGLQSRPLTVVDSKNRIVLWYLPGLLSDKQQVVPVFPSLKIYPTNIQTQSEVRKATLDISPLLQKSVKQAIEGRATLPNWRVYRPNFKPKTGGRICEPGAVTFSGGWFAQGHVGPEYPLKPSANLKPADLHLGGGKWMESSRELEKFLNLTLSLIHPELFDSGKQMLRSLRDSDNTKAVADGWQSVYTGIQTISNRVTQSHRDSKGRPEWFDLLVSYCAGGSTPYFSVKDIGLELKYSSGTVIGFCGTVFKHGVKAWGPGDRVCVAHFMREEVRERLAVDPAGWSDQLFYAKHIPGGFPLTIDSDYMNISD